MPCGAGGQRGQRGQREGGSGRVGIQGLCMHTQWPAGALPTRLCPPPPPPPHTPGCSRSQGLQLHRHAARSAWPAGQPAWQACSGGHRAGVGCIQCRASSSRTSGKVAPECQNIPTAATVLTACAQGKCDACPLRSPPARRAAASGAQGRRGRGGEGALMWQESAARTARLPRVCSTRRRQVRQHSASRK